MKRCLRLFYGYAATLFMLGLFSHQAYAKFVWEPEPPAVQEVSKDSELTGLHDVKSPTMLEFSDRRYMWFSGTSKKDDYGLGGIHFSSNKGGKWSEPKVAFTKPYYKVGDPAVIRHPVRNQIYMLYTMTARKPEIAIIRQRDGKVVKKKKRPTPSIGIAYATWCRDSIDDSNLCWKDLSEKRALIDRNNSFNFDGASDPAVFLEGARMHVYYKTNAPSSQLVRAIIDIRDWKIQETKPLTFQSYDRIMAKWNHHRPDYHFGISSPDVKQYNGGIMMVANDFTSNAISRFVSNDGIQFLRDPNDNNASFLNGIKDHVKDPFLKVIDNDTFQIYYAKGDHKSPCNQHRAKVGSLVQCIESIEAKTFKDVRRMELFRDERKNLPPPDIIPKKVEE